MRPLCPHCQRPTCACLCAWATPTSNRLPVLVLQHPLEASQAKGTVRLLRLSLAQCQLEVGLQFNPSALAGWLGAPGSSLLLYPDSPGAPPAQPDGQPEAPAPGHASALPRPQRLVLLDGTWRQARGLLRANPLLQTLPRWALPAPAPSRYAIRQAHHPAQRSTLEAACAALALLEDRPSHYAPLLQAFSAWVANLAAQAAAGRVGSVARSSVARPAAGS